MATLESVKQFEKDGYLVIENFLIQDEIALMRREIYQVVEEMNPAEHHSVFTTDPKNPVQAKDDYFLTSGDKVRFFFEKDALNRDGELQVDKQHSLNKVGHALHVYCPAYRNITLSDKVKNISHNLGFKKPKVCQSMVIFKQPRIGGAVTPHQDCSFLYLEGQCKVVGMWFALEDATLENGCMWFMPGSHKNGLDNNRRFIRNPDKDGPNLIYTNDLKQYENKDFVCAPVKAGSLVLIDGFVVHKSEANTSNKSRNIYTFHMFESDKAEWSKGNWLQATGEDPEKTFTPLY